MSRPAVDPARSGITIAPLSPERVSDFAVLARQMGSNRSCWCLYWRRGDVREPGSARERLERLVGTLPHPTGLIAYDEEIPVGWVALSPRAQYPRLNRGRDTAPIDDRPDVWVIPCLFVKESHRGRGLTTLLIERAVAEARECGARIVEGVPGDPETKLRSPSASYTGTVSMFKRAGFSEVARRTPKGRVIVRRDV